MRGWDTVRTIRLTIGLGIGAYALISSEYLLLILAGIFIMQSIMNISCCGTGGCGVENRNVDKTIYQDQIKEYKK